MEVAGENWDLMFREFVKRKSFATEPLHLFHKLELHHLIKPKYLILTYRVKRPPNLLLITDKLIKEKKSHIVTSFLTHAADFSLFPLQEKTKFIQSLRFVPPDDPLLQVDDDLKHDLSFDVIRKQVTNFCRKHEIPNPFLNHFEGIQEYIQTYCKQYAAGELEKYELKQRLLKFCTITLKCYPGCRHIFCQ